MWQMWNIMFSWFSAAIYQTLKQSDVSIYCKWTSPTVQQFDGSNQLSTLRAGPLLPPFHQDDWVLVLGCFESQFIVSSACKPFKNLLFFHTWRARAGPQVFFFFVAYLWGRPNCKLTVYSTDHCCSVYPLHDLTVLLKMVVAWIWLVL